MANSKKESQARHVAGLYYEQKLGQNEIAEILDCSLSKVSRLLSDAHAMGLVEISVKNPVEILPDLSSRIRSEFNLREAIVVSQGATEDIDYRNVGKAAADFLTGLIEDGTKLGITWGKTLAELLNHLPPNNVSNVEIYQISGSLGYGNMEIDGPRLAIKLAETLGTKCELIPAPAMVGSEELRDAIISQKQIQSTLERASNVDIIIQGVGSIEDGMSSLERAGYVNSKELEEARKFGAVGHVFARMIDIDGQEVSDFSKRVIGIPLECLRRAKWSIGISASKEKVPAIFGALRGGYFNTLVIEEASACQLIEMTNATSEKVQKAG